MEQVKTILLNLQRERPNNSPMSKHLATAVRKNSPLTGRNLKQNPALGGRPSALTGWVEREREEGWVGGRHRSRTATTTTITTDTRLAAANSNNSRNSR